MHSKRQGKRKTALFLTTAMVMASIMAVPQAAYGAERLIQQRAQQEAAQKALEAKLKAEEVKSKAEGAKAVSLDTYSKALKDPAAALDNAQPLGIELNRAVTIGGSAVHGMPVTNNAEKIAVLEAIEHAGGGAADDLAKENVAKALGLDPAGATTRADVGHFITKAKNELVKLPGKKGKIGDLKKYKAAMTDPRAALTAAGAGTLTQAITDAVAVHGSAASAHVGHIGSEAEKIAVLKAIYGAPGGTDDVAKAAVATALGLDPATGAADVERFIKTASKVLEKLPQKKAQIGNLEKYKAAMTDPATALNTAGAGTLTEAITHAIGAVGSRAEAVRTALGHPPGTLAEKIQVLEAVHGAPAGGDDAAKAAVATALGLDPATGAADVGHFIEKAKNQHLAPIYKDALLDPVANVLNVAAAPGNLSDAIHEAVDHASTSIARGMPDGAASEKLAVLKRIEANNVPAENKYRSAIRRGLGLDPDVTHFAATKPSLDRFIEMADYDINIAGLLLGLGGGTKLEHVEQILARLAAAHNRANDGALIAVRGGGAAPLTIHQALARIGL